MLEVGRIAKPHGLRGEVIVALVTDRTERVDPGTVLHAGEHRLTVVSSAPHAGRWIVAFEGVSGREEAEALSGARLTAEPLDDPDAWWVHDLIGSLVVDTGGREHGAVVAVVANPASDLLELEGGELVPMRFVTGRRGGRVTVDVPDGLFDV